MAVEPVDVPVVLVLARVEDEHGDAVRVAVVLEHHAGAIFDMQRDDDTEFEAEVALFQLMPARLAWRT